MLRALAEERVEQKPDRLSPAVSLMSSYYSTNHPPRQASDDAIIHISPTSQVPPIGSKLERSMCTFRSLRLRDDAAIKGEPGAR